MFLRSRLNVSFNVKGKTVQKKFFSSSFYARPKDSIMWSAQDKVPRLPIPTLEETLDRYVECLQPLISEKQLANTKQIIEEFKKGEGIKLQKELENLDKESPTSWLEGFWDSMYLEIRDPILINVNPYLILIEDEKRPQQIVRAAHLVASCLDMFHKIRDNTLQPDFEKKEPLDMSQYKKLFASVRIPKSGRDLCLTYPESEHIIVLSKNRFYKVPVLKGKNSISEGELQSQLQYILNDSKKLGNGTPMGVFTGDEREHWARIRSNLELDTKNKKILETMDQALFILTLEDFVPKNMKEIGPHALHGDGTNKWFDKFNVLVYPNGQSGVNFEHSPVDGHSVLRLWMEDLQFRKNPVVSASNTSNDSSSFGKVERLDWNVTNEIKNELNSATRRVKKLIDSIDSSVLLFDKFGKNGMTKVKASPDAFVQMAFQLAYYKLYGHPDSTYESANTKRFIAGRTETVRTVSNESLNFTKIWQDSSASPADKALSLRAAMDKHVIRMNFCKNGRGVDRHLWVLSKLARHKKQRLPDRYYNYPELFTDPSFGTLLTSVLSTSNVSAPCFSLFGFGPVVPNGLGLAYCIHDDKVAFHVTSFQGESKKFTTKLEESLQQMEKGLN